jgi:hypothetical protein
MLSPRNSPENSLFYEPLAKIPKAVLARVERLFSFVLEAMRSLFRQLVAAASPSSAVFDHAAAMPSKLGYGAIQYYAVRRMIVNRCHTPHRETRPPAAAPATR